MVWQVSHQSTLPEPLYTRPASKRVRNSHCDQRYMIVSELMNVRSQSKENPSFFSWPIMCSAQRATHALGGSLPAIAPSSAGKPKESKPNANSTSSPRALQKRA